jgi:hypothetical protein
MDLFQDLERVGHRPFPCIRPAGTRLHSLATALLTSFGPPYSPSGMLASASMMSWPAPWLLAFSTS